MMFTFVTFFGFFGFGVGGDAEEPYAQVIEPANQQIIRAIDTKELNGFNILESHEADEWFV